MKHSDFKIGNTFWSAGGSFRWLCTDIGTRTIAAIRVPNEYDATQKIHPPYGIAEHVFDEYDMPGCATSPGELE